MDEAGTGDGSTSGGQVQDPQFRGASDYSEDPKLVYGPELRISWRGTLQVGG